MNCKTCKERLMEYVDGEMSHSDYKMIEAHLSACQACAQEKDMLVNSILPALRNIGHVNPPDRVWEHIHKCITDYEEKVQESELSAFLHNIFSVQHLKFVAAAASIVLIVSVYFTVRGIFIGNMINEYLEENAYFVAQMTNIEYDSFLEIEDVNFGAAIEDYFL